MQKFEFKESIFARSSIGENKKLWLIPILLILGLVALVAIISQAPALAPLIYTLF